MFLLAFTVAYNYAHANRRLFVCGRLENTHRIDAARFGATILPRSHRERR